MDNGGMIDLRGKHIVITGASAGIGAGLARELGRRGARLVLAARRGDKLNGVAQDVQAAGGEAFAVTVDVTERAQVFKLAEAARTHFGEIDIWVSNAGAGIRHRLLEATEADMLAQFRLNCLSSLWGYQAVLPAWLEQKRSGQIIDVSSVAGKIGFAYGGGYCAAKHALSAIGDTMRQELAGRGIHITTVYPGPTVSDFSDAATDRTAGEYTNRAGRMQKHRSLLVRKVAHRQSTDYVVQRIIRAMERPVPVVYPHRWSAYAVLLGNLLPGFALRQAARAGIADR